MSLQNVKAYLPNAAGKLRKHAWLLMLIVLSLVACGGGSGDENDGGANTFAPSPGGPRSDSGEVVIALTDADGEFLTYAVDVASLSLVRQDGTEVQAMPAPMHVDFVQYRALAEFVTATSVPPGTYTGVRMVLDYGNANIQLDTGTVAARAIVHDATGNALTTVESFVALASERPLVVTAQTTSHLSLDFDLDASNIVDREVSPPVVKVEPVLIADIEPEVVKPHRLQGVITGIQRARNTYNIRMQPFHAPDGDFGTLTVYTTDTTVFEVNGRASRGVGGVIMLGGLAPSTPVVTLGELSSGSRRFVASVVYAGRSVPGMELDGVTGQVVARTGEVLTLRGATVTRRGGDVAFADDVSVSVSGNTQVRREGDIVATYAADAISVGQSVTALGIVRDDQDGVLDVDATAGMVRLLVTEIEGDALAHSEGELVVDVQHIGGRNVETFDFNGTGVAASDDADPSAFQVDVGTINLAGLQPGDPVRVRGYVNGFGSAPPDFIAARVLRANSGSDARLGLSWDPPTATPLLANSDRFMAIGTDNLGALRHVTRRGVALDVAELGTFTLSADTDGMGMFAIKVGREVQMFRRFADFSAALSALLGDGKSAQRIAALGEFNEENVTLVTRRATVILVAP